MAGSNQSEKSAVDHTWLKYKSERQILALVRAMLQAKVSKATHAASLMKIDEFPSVKLSTPGSSVGLRVEGSRFGVEGLGLGSCSRFGVQGSVHVHGFGFRVRFIFWV